ncbi:diguanylate cyclase [Myxococcota bacterium]|nr:diguanylate cyclase [Myxococcota bacterium]
MTAVLAIAVLAAEVTIVPDELLLGARFVALLLVPLALVLWRRRTPEVDFAIGPAILAVLHVMIGMSGGLATSPAHPLVFVWAAVVASLLTPRAAIATGVLALGAELAAFATGVEPLPVTTLLAHAGFLALFASLFGALLNSEVVALRERSDAAMGEALARVEEDARDFRLIGASLRPEGASREPQAAQQVRTVGSVSAIRASLVDVLEVARLAVDADAALVFLLDGSGSTLKLKECVSIAGERSVVERPLPASEGALGAVVKTRRAVNLRPREGGKSLGYRTKNDVGSFLAVPIHDQGHVVGVLAVDRAATTAFAARDEELLVAVSREVERALETERVFVAMDGLKYEQQRLYEAFTLLAEGLTVEKFAEKLLDAVARIKKADFSAVTLFDADAHVHTIIAARKGDGTIPSTLTGATFPSRDGGLVESALKNGHALPYVPLSQQPTREKLSLFGRLGHPELQAVKVFPLVERGAPVGALVVGSTVSGQELTREEERIFDVVTAHAAVSLSNARMYAKMETMATTDGLTGLVNHRRFKELLTEALARAARFTRQVSVVMVDADHFKSINDTWGHPVGDLVLKRVAAILKAEARRTDVVARYGGEEFVVVLDETDSPGAELVAERIRERIEREVIEGEFGRVRVTASLGVATWPANAGVMEDLLEAADQALYEAKRKGRNRVVLSRAVHCADPDPAAIRREEGASEQRSA